MKLSEYSTPAVLVVEMDPAGQFLAGGSADPGHDGGEGNYLPGHDINDFLF